LEGYGISGALIDIDVQALEVFISESAVSGIVSA